MDIGFWEIDEGIEDAERFFGLIGQLLPGATHLFVEASTVAEDVEACYGRHADPGLYLPRRHTLWPRARLFRCRSSHDLLREMAELAASHAAPELLDHLTLCEGAEMLLEWPDAFANRILLNGALSEATVASLAGPFGLRYGRRRARRV